MPTTTPAPAWSLRSSLDDHGTVAVLTAVMLAALVGIHSLGYEAARGFCVRAALDKAVDASARAAARDYALPGRDATAEAVFLANFPSGSYGADSPVVVVTGDDVQHKATVTARVALPTILGRTLTVSASAAAAESSGTVRPVSP